MHRCSAAQNAPRPAWSCFRADCEDYTLLPKVSGRKLGIDRKDHRLLSIAIDALLARNDRQLKHPRVLAFRQHVQENCFSVRKRDGIVMLMRRARLNRAKSGDAKA